MAIRATDTSGVTRTVLGSVPLFAKWPPDAFAELCGAAQMWRFAKGETLYRFGEPMPGLIVLAQGSLLNVRFYPNGKRMATAILKAGWPVGVLPAWDELDCAYDGVARTDCLAIVISHKVVRALLRGDAERMAQVADMLSAQIRQDTESLLARSVSSQRCLLAKYLAYLCRPSLFVTREDPTAVDPVATDVTQDELAAMIAASRQTVNRLMKGLERDGVLKRRGALVEIVNFRRLLAVMEEDEPIPPLWRAQILAWHERLMSRPHQAIQPSLGAAHREADRIAG